MISPAAPPRESRTPSGADRWRQSWLIVLLATAVLFGAVAIGRQLFAGTTPAGHPVAAASPAELVVPVPSEVPSIAPGSPPPAVPADSTAAETPVFPAGGVMRIDGPVPAEGSGDFQYAGGHSPVYGTRGPVRRFKVAVEKGSGEDVPAFAAQVVATLSDERGWTGSGRLRMQMVDGAEKADFTVYLATRETAELMCERGGTNIRIGGVPFTSCRATGKVILNLDRWRESARPYLESGADLAAYRQYVINHEVGHELGHRHEGCPKAGGPAPVMVQQTLTLRGCKPYSWPRRNDEDLTGPSL
ncbi:DUF3152 domain-containing protein [Actinoplanes hulinensis]|uniref:DUF3152 domain-containing protein n=1 Tax=Actinoplanes hulinensis TaxID=1144547 RepID=A0ABS7AVL7_9ACTN|nr:DUF3152 domain-containing protein [Actinoplanes hulinensis]MBW6432765.1 DUF3152 domain-containing protein [Actinoplanes hulinensis]